MHPDAHGVCYVYLLYALALFYFLIVCIFHALQEQLLCILCFGSILIVSILRRGMLLLLRSSGGITRACRSIDLELPVLPYDELRTGMKTQIFTVIRGTWARSSCEPLYLQTTRTFRD